MGITKYMILGAVAFALAPMPPEGPLHINNATPVAALQTHEMISVAIGTFADVASFCERQPQTCEVLSNIADIAQAKAKYSIRLAYEWANGSPAAGLQLKGTLPVSGPGEAIDLGPAPSSDAGLTTGVSNIFKSSLAADPVVTGSFARMASADEGSNTLRIDDLVPEWRGPELPQQG